MEDKFSVQFDARIDNTNSSKLKFVFNDASFIPEDILDIIDAGIYTEKEAIDVIGRNTYLMIGCFDTNKVKEYNLNKNKKYRVTVEEIVEE